MLFNGNDIEVRDHRGLLIEQGDIITASFGSSSNVNIRLGKVLEYIERQQQYSAPNCYLEVEWLYGTSWLPDGKSTKIKVYTYHSGNTRNVKNPWHYNKFFKVGLL